MTLEDSNMDQMEDETQLPSQSPKHIRENQDELIIQRQDEIAHEIMMSTSLVGPKESLLHLEREYFADEIYSAKVKDVASKYAFIRKTRPDGNCFYRAFAFSYFEYLFNNKDKCLSFRNIIVGSQDDLIHLGFPPLTLEDFYETFLTTIDIITDTKTTEEKLCQLFNDTETSDYIVVYLRVLTSGQLQKDAEFYQNFIEGNRSVAEFCHQEVEPMAKESDHIHIIALSAALEVGIRVKYMDRGESTHAIAHDFPEGKEPSVHLLYRPGHYDILYPIEDA